jgi:23S rRNA-/tRNA-specific pseudouridylate synthase
LQLPKAIIDLPIERNPKSPQSFRVGETGKAAQTEYEVVEENENLTLIKLRPTTGRTHQLRVHLSHLNHPIVGDDFYGGKKASRMFLHAELLELTLPDKTRQVFEAKLPKVFKTYLENND